MAKKKRKIVNKFFGKYLNSLRKKQGNTIEGVANATGISTSYLSVLERQKEVYPSLPILISISNYYNISVFELLMILLYENESDSKNENCVLEISKEEIIDILNFLLTVDLDNCKKISDLILILAKIEKLKIICDVLIQYLSQKLCDDNE